VTLALLYEPEVWKYCGLILENGMVRVAPLKNKVAVWLKIKNKRAAKTIFMNDFQHEFPGNNLPRSFHIAENAVTIVSHVQNERGVF
jgi:hypothetical protein